MKCLRSGYCCTHYDVVIVDDENLGIAEDNLKHKPTGEKCQHLKGDVVGQYSCGIHHYDWYKETPCFEYTQIGDPDAECRMGRHMLNLEKLGN